MRYRLSISEKIFKLLNYGILALLSCLTLYPFWYVLISSISDPVTGKNAYFWVKHFYYANYWLVLSTPGLGQAYLITVLRVVAAVPLMLLVTGGAAFALTRKELYGRKTIIILFFITMFFGGGLIPYYMVLKTMRLINTFWVYVIPSMFGVWTMIIMKTSFNSLPEGLVEAAIIDGANYGMIFFRIIIPLSLPMLATLGLFSAVGHWNDWFSGAFYVQNAKLLPLQTFLQIKVLLSGYNSLMFIGMTADESLTRDPRLILQLRKITPRSLESAYILLATVPILIVYPWIQKYFVKGVLIGSIKE